MSRPEQPAPPLRDEAGQRPVAERQLVHEGMVWDLVRDTVDFTADVRFDPNGSVCAIEGITSPDGRVFGKMGHTERTGAGLYRNVPGDYDMHLFTSAVEYFK